MLILVLILGTVGVIFMLISAGAQAWAIVSAAVVAVIFILGISLVNATLTGIYTAAVYQFASTGDAGSYFETDAVQNAFQPAANRKII